MHLQDDVPVKDHTDAAPRPYLGDALREAGLTKLADKCDGGAYCTDRNDNAEAEIEALWQDLCDENSSNFNADIGAKVLGGYYDHTPRS
jgi:hypothetical protein